MVTKKFGKDFFSEGGALTLHTSEITSEDYPQHGTFRTRTHEDGWTIKGVVKSDYYSWVNEFRASHPQLGRVWGNFEEEVFADSEEAFQDFYKHHTPKAWDYDDN